MCMITYLAPGTPVPYEEIHNGTTWNDMGHGWAIAAGPGQMLTGHSMNAEGALDAFDIVRGLYPDAHALFHSRLATHGLTNVDNCHPFNVGDANTVVAHNGILPAKFQPAKGKDAAMSDTAILAAKWLPGRIRKGQLSWEEKVAIGNVIGSGNKLVILSADPRLPDGPVAHIVNSYMGEWDGRTGAWFSNRDYESAWSYTPSRYGGFGLWSATDAEDAEVTVIGGKSEDKEPWITAHPCPLCGVSGHVELRAGVCNACDSCLDCCEALRDCMCFYNSTLRDAATGQTTESEVEM